MACSHRFLPPAYLSLPSLVHAEWLGAAAGHGRSRYTLSKRVKPLIRRSSGSTRAAPPAPAPRRKTVSPLVPAPAATPAAVSRAGTTCQHLRTGPAQAKPPQQPLSARARDNEARAYLHAPTPRDSRSVPSDSVKCHSDRAVRPLRYSRRRPRRADHHRHPGSVGWRGPMHGGCRPKCMGFCSSH